MTGAAATAGGIASSNLNVLQALQDLSRQSGRRLIVLSLHEEIHHRPDFLDEECMFLGFSGSKWRYTLRLLSLFRHDGFYLFDHVRLGLPILPAAFLGFRRFVVLAHGSESWKRVRRTSKWLFQKAQMCLTNSKFTLARMEETFSGFDGRACTLGLPPAHEVADEETDRSEVNFRFESVDGVTRELGERVVLLVGRMDRGEREKGHEELLAVWPSVLERHHDAQLVFVGPGDDRAALMSTAVRLGVASAVLMPGYLPTDVLRQLYSRCRALVMPSRQEGFGLVYLEAMNCGKPCVGCRNGGGEELIDDGVSGFLLDNPFENEELLQILNRLLGDEDLSARLGREGLRRLRANYTAAHAQRRLRQLLAPML